MNIRLLSRRRLLQQAALLPLATVPVLSGCGAAAPTYCIDPKFLGAGEARMRETLEYVEISKDASTQCVSCQFFGGADDAHCGHCELLNGPVAAQGYCTSWVLKT